MTASVRHLSAAVTLALVLASAAGPALGADAPPCPPGAERFTEYRLFFGRSQGDREVVSEEDWRAFLADEVTPRFPNGLTVLDAARQWRAGSGAIVRERTKLLLVLAEPGTDAMRRTDEDRGGLQARLRPVGRAARRDPGLRVVLEPFEARPRRSKAARPPARTARPVTRTGPSVLGLVRGASFDYPAG